MRKSELDWIEQVILTSGIASRTQRKAIVQRVRDAYDLRAMILRSAEGVNDPTLLDRAFPSDPKDPK